MQNVFVDLEAAVHDESEDEADEQEEIFVHGIFTFFDLHCVAHVKELDALNRNDEGEKSTAHWALLDQMLRRAREQDDDPSWDMLLERANAQSRDPSRRQRLAEDNSEDEWEYQLGENDFLWEIGCKVCNFILDRGLGD